MRRQRFLELRLFLLFWFLDVLGNTIVQHASSRRSDVPGFPLPFGMANLDRSTCHVPTLSLGTRLTHVFYMVVKACVQ